MIGKIESFSKAMKLFFEIGTPFGALIVLWYSFYNVGYLPSGLTLGDTLYLVMVSLACSLVFLLFVAALVGLGNGLTRTAGWIFVRPFPFRVLDGAKKYLDDASAVAPGLPVAIFATFGLLLVVVTGVVSIESGIAAFFVAIAMGHFAVSFFRDDMEAKHCAEELAKAVFVSGDKGKEQLEKDRDRAVRGKRVSIFALIFLPIAMGGMAKPVLNGAMALSHLRENEADIYVKKAYCDVVKAEYPDRYTELAGGNFCKFANMAVLFNGIGANTVIAPPDDYEHFLPLPSKELVVRSLSANKSVEPTR